MYLMFLRLVAWWKSPQNCHNHPSRACCISPIALCMSPCGMARSGVCLSSNHCSGLDSGAGNGQDSPATSLLLVLPSSVLGISSTWDGYRKFCNVVNHGPRARFRVDKGTSRSRQTEECSDTI